MIVLLLSKSWQIIRFRKFRPKNNFFYRFFVIFFGVFNSKSWLIIRFRQFGPKNNFRILLIFCQFFWCHLKVGSLFGADNFEPKIIFLDFFLDFFCQFFGVILKLAHYSFQKILSQKYFSIFELEKYDRSIVGSVEDVDC